MQVVSVDLTPSTTTDRLWSLKDACSLLGGISRTTLWELRNSGRLTTVTQGSRCFITGRSIASYINSLPVQSPEAA